MVCTPDMIVKGGCSGGSIIIPYLELAGAGLGVSIVILAFLYVWATLFRNSQLNAYVKSELYELFVTGLLIIFILGLLGAMSELTLGDFLTDDMIPQGEDADGNEITKDTSVFAATYAYYIEVGKDMKSWLNVNYWLSMYVDQIASVTPYARPLGVGLVASPFAGFGAPLKQLLYNISVALSIAFIINTAQQYVYLFALQAFIKYYLPMGLFFRTFTPLRRLGGALIGISLAFLFVFPALTILDYSIFYNKDAGPLVTFRGLVEGYFGDTTASFWSHFEKFYENNFTGVGSSVTTMMGAAFGGIGSLLQSFIGGIFLMVMIFPISIVSYAFTIGFIIPAFNIIIFTQVAKSLSKSFGEEVDLTSLTRMV